MSEEMDREQNRQPETAEQSTPAEQTPAALFNAAPPVLKKKKRSKKKLIRRIVALVIVAALLGGGIFAWRKLVPGDDAGAGEVLTDMVSRGSITSMVEGSGAAVAKNSASITLLSGGQVLEVYVSEGDYVHAGDPLYVIESSDAQARVNEAEKSVNSVQKELDALYKEASDLNIRAEYAGKLLNLEKKLQKGDKVFKDQVVATLADDTRMLLTLYFSYAYENEIYVGQSATVSIPATMAQLSGTVHEIHKVRRISDEGAQLFAVVIVMDNPGTLTAGMTASATLSGGAETIYPYESGKLEYFRSMEMKAKVNGEVEQSNLYEYAAVSAGESVVSLTAESSETEIATLENQLRSAKKTLEEAQKNLDSLNGYAPIDGTVLTLGVRAGEEAKTGTVAANIADTTTMIVNANIDEMNVSYAKAGMPVSIKLWENEMMGVIDSVSLSAKAENGVARFPMVISVDNSEGQLMSGAYVNYSFTASQSDDCLVVPIQCVKSAQTMDGESCKVLFVQLDAPPEELPELASDMSDVPEGFYPVIVETGISDNYNVEIKSGAEEGMTVYAGVMSSGGGMGMFF